MLYEKRACGRGDRHDRAVAGQGQPFEMRTSACDLERLGFRPGMRLVVAGTAPLNYLVLIDAIELLPKLFAKVFTPEAVRATS